VIGVSLLLKDRKTGDLTTARKQITAGKYDAKSNMGLELTPSLWTPATWMAGKQAAILTYIDAYQRFPGDPETQEHEFIVYAYQAIKWATMRHFRQENGRNKQIGFVNRLSEDDALMDYLDQISDPHCDPDNAVIYNDLFEKLYQVCDPRERRFQVLRYLANASLKEIAVDLNITRRTANNIKFRVQ